MKIVDFSVETLKSASFDWQVLLSRLSMTRIFDNISEPDIVAILHFSKILTLNSNEYLITQNDLENDLYVVIRGHLVITKNSGTHESYIAEISPIDTVGEMSFFTNFPRNANVIAIRDSILIKFEKEKIIKNPQFINMITNIARIVTERLSSGDLIPLFYKRKIQTITLIPAGGYSEIKSFSKIFFKAASFYENCILQVEEDFVLNKDKFVSDIYSRENDYRYIINVLSNKVSDWSRLCINQTDHMIFVGHENGDIALNEVEKYIFQSRKYIHKKEIVLLRNRMSNKRVMNDWLSPRKIDGYYNIVDKEDDYFRLVRSVIGKSTCLVLSGGGARGLAHVGTIKALLEKNIPIDMIAGTSMGALVGGAYAKYADFDKFYEAMERFCRSQKLNRYTLPFLSIFNGEGFTEGIKELFEDTYIENLHRRFFCAACNLSQLKLEIFDFGLLWNAVRASSAIPAIFPPIINIKGEILVDGCILNNMPVDHMRMMSNGGKIIASQIVQTRSFHHFDSCNGIAKGTRLLFRKLNPFSEKINLPNINFLFMKSLLISSQAHQITMAREADICLDHDIKKVGLLEFSAIRKIVEQGYKNTLVQLRESEEKRK